MKYTPAELSALLSKELRQALGSPGSEIAALRLRNLQYYKAEAEGELAAPEIADRSSLVATDVADTVEWILPGLLRPFVTSQDALQARARKPEYAEGAQQVADYLRWLFWKQNRGFHLLAQWFKDALIQKVGFLKIGTVEIEEDAEENYEGLNEAQMLILSQDKEGKIIGQESFPGPEGILYNATFKRTTKKRKAQVKPVPPEEMRVHPRSRYGEPVLFAAHVFYKTKQDLEADGYDLSQASSDAGWNMEEIERVSTQTPWFYDSSDGEMAQYRFSECYIKLDQDEDGVAEWLKVGLIGETVATLNGKDDIEKVDDHPFEWFCPVPMPHTFFGLCPADQAIEPQRFRTSLIRSCADNVYLSVNKRVGVVEGEVEIDDVLNNRPGGIVRMKHANSIFPLEQNGLDAGAWQMVEWAEQWREDRTGFSKQTQGINPDIFNATKGGTQILTDRADMRIELMARNASDAVERMFAKLLKTVSLYQNTPELAELQKGAWQTVDPRDWHKQYEIELEVGLGTGDKDKQVAFLGTMLPVFEKLVAGGVIDPSGALKATKDMMDFGGLPNPEQYLVPAQPKPPQPTDAQVKAQSDLALEQARGQVQKDVAQFRTQAEIAQSEGMQRGEVAKFQAEAQIKNADRVADRDMQLTIEREKMASNERIEQMKAASAERIEGARIAAAQLAARNPMAQERANFNS